MFPKGFVEKLYKNDVVRVFPFSGSFDPNAELKGPGWSENATLATRSATLIDQISNLVAGGGTALYDAINGAYNLIKNRKSVDLSYGSRRNYGFVTKKKKPLKSYPIESRLFMLT